MARKCGSDSFANDAADFGCDSDFSYEYYSESGDEAGHALAEHCKERDVGVRSAEPKIGVTLEKRKDADRAGAAPSSEVARSVMGDGKALVSSSSGLVGASKRPAADGSIGSTTKRRRLTHTGSERKSGARATSAMSATPQSLNAMANAGCSRIPRRMFGQSAAPGRRVELPPPPPPPPSSSVLPPSTSSRNAVDHKVLSANIRLQIGIALKGIADQLMKAGSEQ